MFTRLFFGKSQPAAAGACGYLGVPGACNPSFLDLCNAMKDGKPLTVVGPDRQGRTGYILAIEMEDGSGHNWNITMRNGKHEETFFIRAY